MHNIFYENAEEKNSESFEFRSVGRNVSSLLFKNNHRITKRTKLDITQGPKPYIKLKFNIH